MLPHIQLGGSTPQGYVVPTFPKYQTDGKKCPVSNFKGYYDQRGNCIPATAQNYTKPEHVLPKHYQIKKESNILFEKSVTPTIPNQIINPSQHPSIISLNSNDEELYESVANRSDSTGNQICINVGHHYLPKSNKCMRCGIAKN